MLLVFIKHTMHQSTWRVYGSRTNVYGVLRLRFKTKTHNTTHNLITYYTRLRKKNNWKILVNSKRLLLLFYFSHFNAITCIFVY